MVYFNHEQDDSIIPEASQRMINILAAASYPIIICNSFSNFYSVEVESTGKPSPIDNHFQLEINYAYIDPGKKHQNEYFLIDVLDFQKMDSFLDSLEADVKAMEVLLPEF